MNRGNLTIGNNNKIKIELSKILEFIPNNNLNWYILELSASGNLKSSILNISIIELLKQIRSNNKGLKLNFLELIDIAKHLDSLDECFITGCKQKNIQPINQIIENKNICEYVIDFYDSTTLNISSSDLIFLEHFLRFYNNGGFLI